MHRGMLNKSKMGIVFILVYNIVLSLFAPFTGPKVPRFTLHKASSSKGDMLLFPFFYILLLISFSLDLGFVLYNRFSADDGKTNCSYSKQSQQTQTTQ